MEKNNGQICSWEYNYVAQYMAWIWLTLEWDWYTDLSAVVMKYKVKMAWWFCQTTIVDGNLIRHDYMYRVTIYYQLLSEIISNFHSGGKCM